MVAGVPMTPMLPFDAPVVPRPSNPVVRELRRRESNRDRVLARLKAGPAFNHELLRKADSGRDASRRADVHRRTGAGRNDSLQDRRCARREPA